MAISSVDAEKKRVITFLSSDTKPIAHSSGSEYEAGQPGVEVDTGKRFEFYGGTWYASSDNVKVISTIEEDLTGLNQSDTITLASDTNFDVFYIDWANVVMFTVSALAGAGTITPMLAPDGVTFSAAKPIDVNTGALITGTVTPNGSYKLETNGAALRFSVVGVVSAGTIGWNAKVSV